MLFGVSGKTKPHVYGVILNMVFDLLFWGNVFNTLLALGIIIYLYFGGFNPLFGCGGMDGLPVSASKGKSQV